MKKQFPFYKQIDASDCGPTCLRIVSKYYGKSVPIEMLRKKSYISKDGVSVSNIAYAAESIGFRTLGITTTYEKLAKEVPLPCIALWKKKHFVVIYKIKNNMVYVSDPAFGLAKYPEQEFMTNWRNFSPEKGVLLILEPAPSFNQNVFEEPDKNQGLKLLFKHVFRYKKHLIQLLLGVLVGSVLQLFFPFLTQAIVDYGIKDQNISFVYLILIAQISLFFSRSSVDMIRGWLLLHVGVRVNVAIISDFLIKLMRLPVSLFDSKSIGDIMQRIDDNRRLERFLSSSSLNAIFSFISIIIFSIVLGYYNTEILLTFIIGTIIYVGWISLFLKKTAIWEYKRIDQNSDERSKIIALIRGIKDIKINGSENKRRWEWEEIQAKLFHISTKRLGLNQYQTNGALFINELKNILIIFISAKAVIAGQMSLGMMLAVQYIIGQLNSPIVDIISFLQSFQDVKIRLERIAEIHNEEDEIKDSMTTTLPVNKTLAFKNVTFMYDTGPKSRIIINNLSFVIPEGKTTAIVGVSGSGKTTLLNLLLKFYLVKEGEIGVGDFNLDNIDTNVWRRKCGVVMQDGFIFTDTIASNIAESLQGESIDRDRMLHAVKVANLEGMINSLPSGLDTKIGEGGIQLSGGQKQRILIARAIFKDPDYLFLDEATSSLDAENEKVIVRNLNEVFVNKTVVIIAHRLSTVMNADNIVVLDKGEIVEQGNHESLLKGKARYFNLVKDQLALGA